jgi:hypothetical protein
MARVAAITWKERSASAWATALRNDYLSQTDTTAQDIRSDVDIATKRFQRTITAETLGVGATTFAVTGEAMEITGDGGGNNVATITGGLTGQILILTFVDALVTIVNDDTHAANTIDLVAAANLTSADDTTLMLFFNGTSWYELSRSVN